MKAPAFQFYVADFLVGTAILSNEEKGIYITLLCYQWAHGRIPKDTRIIARLAGCSERKLPLVLSKFKVGDDGTYYNERLENERIKQEEFREKQRSNGMNGGRPRTSKDKPSDNPSLSPKETQTKALQSSSSSSDNTPPTPSRPSGIPVDVKAAIEAGRTAGVPADFAREVYLEHDGTTWTFAGKPITNWASYLKSRFINQQSRQAERAQNFSRPAKTYTKPQPRVPTTPIPPWVDQLTKVWELVKKIPNPDATQRAQIVAAIKALPREAWTMIKGEDYNILNGFLKS